MTARPTSRPLLCAGPVVLATLADLKTMTRRLAKFVPIEGTNLGFSGLSPGQYCTGDLTSGAVLYARGRGGVWEQRTAPLKYFALPGDRLWVRETWGLRAHYDITDWHRRSITAWDSPPPNWMIDYRAGWGPNQEECFWRPSIHMPRWASRLTLEVTGVRLERLQAITEADARAEGVELLKNGLFRDYTNDRTSHHTAVDSFRSLWGALYGEASWASNPWVWAITFKRLRTEEVVRG